MPGVSQYYVDPHLLPRVSLGLKNGPRAVTAPKKSDYLALAQLLIAKTPTESSARSVDFFWIPANNSRHGWFMVHWLNTSQYCPEL